MNTLTTFAAYCRAMADAEHTDECGQRLADWELAMDRRRWFGAAEVPDPGPRPTCEGCVSDDDRKWWTRLADEIDQHLAPQVDLFGQMSDEPTEDEA